MIFHGAAVKPLDGRKYGIVFRRHLCLSLRMHEAGSCSRRSFIQRLAQMGVVCSFAGTSGGHSNLWAVDSPPPDSVLKFPGPWQFQLPKGALILVNDQQLRDLADPDKEVDLSLTGTPNRTTLRRVCEQQRAAGARTIILAFDEFWSQYRAGQGAMPRQLMPDTEAYIELVRRLSLTLKEYGLGLELSLLSPLEIGRGYMRQTGRGGRWVQYREGWRDPVTGHYTVSLWEHRRWTNNKGTIEVRRLGVRAFAFREQRIGRTAYYRVAPDQIIPLQEPIETEEATAKPEARLRRLTVRGHGDTSVGALDRVLVVVSYETPEMDYFSPQALPFLKDLVGRYHQAGVPLNGLYADEMHIQQDWGYFQHHDEGQFTLRYLTDSMAQKYAELYGAEFADFEKYLVYFCYGQHGFLDGIDARTAAQHVLGSSAGEIWKTTLLRRRYFDLLEQTVIELFVQAKQHAEQLYGQELEVRAHATWAQSPTIDSWRTGASPLAPRQYEYTPDFEWSNTVHQAASACSDYFRWNEFLTGGGNDHAEGGWSDRNYYGLALACSTGILNRWPNAYAAAWGMPAAALHRHQALQDAFGAAATPWFQALENCVHRDCDTLMLYPLSLVASEERFGSWMVQYGYANYVTPEKLLIHGRIVDGGRIEMAGRRFTTVAVLFEPLPPAGLLPLLESFSASGGKVIWSGPPPRLDMNGASVLDRWQKWCGAQQLRFDQEGLVAAGSQVRFDGALESVPSQMILTDFLVDRIYPADPVPGVPVVAQVQNHVVGLHRSTSAGGSVTYLGFRPRDDQAASLGYEVRTWFQILKALGSYPSSSPDLTVSDNPSVVSRQTPYLVTQFPNGALVVAAHYRSHVESWPGGFHRDAKQDDDILRANPLPPDDLDLKNFRVAGRVLDYRGKLVVGVRLDDHKRLAGFCGHQSDRIRLDGQEHVFADATLSHAAWAPIEEYRRVPGGAVLELWITGSAQVQIPLPAGIAQGRLFFQGPRLGSCGESIPSVVRNGDLHFKVDAAWPQKHLYFIAG
ncbi:MAG TPA: hypothetical protein P5186_24425 [Candidatus Paceibacterota bacterium]|nr:hypothetical protein [Verrucomicrobiota bacterium]HRY51209.1 hypothetical protein [Candidatus Paceibacterota bacterium]